MNNIPDYLKKEANLKPVLIKLFTLIETNFNMTPNIEIMILGDGALWIKNTKNLVVRKKFRFWYKNYSLF